MANVLMLSWEYPPVVVGGLGRHVHALATSLVQTGHQVTVVTRHASGAPLEEFREGVRIVRAPEDPPCFPLATETLLAWTMAFNHSLTRAALRAAQTGEFDVIHAHDWLVTHTAVTLADYLDLPLVATIHATEAGRHQGWLPGDLSRSIHSVEWWLSHRAVKVLVCSEYMKVEVSRLFNVAGDKIQVVPNGVDRKAWKATAAAVRQARDRFAGKGPLVGFAGRLVYEKGVQDLVDAVPRLKVEHPGIKVVIAGDGPYKEDLQEAVRRRGVTSSVAFTGFLTERELPALLGATGATVVPSLYEPFGMVALEAASAGAPLAVSSTGGLAEIVESGVTGMTFPHSDPAALADAVGTLLAEPVKAKEMTRRATAMIAERYGWLGIADKVTSAYQAAVGSAPGLVPEVVIPEGNLLR